LLILLSGVPGGGKTTVGDLLAQRHGFRHVDMESCRFELATRAVDDVESFLADLDGSHNVAISWGFGPFAAVDAVRRIVRAGYVPFWFDGDRAQFFASFIRREQLSGKPPRAVQAMELTYYLQMASIVQTGIKDAIDWIHINPFNGDGTYRLDLDEEIVRLATELWLPSCADGPSIAMTEYTL